MSIDNFSCILLNLDSFKNHAKYSVNYNSKLSMLMNCKLFATYFLICDKNLQKNGSVQIFVLTLFPPCALIWHRIITSNQSNTVKY